MLERMEMKWLLLLFHFSPSNTPFGLPFLLLLVLHLLSEGGALESEANKNISDGSSQ